MLSDAISSATEGNWRRLKSFRTYTSPQRFDTRTRRCSQRRGTGEKHTSRTECFLTVKRFELLGRTDLQRAHTGLFSLAAKIGLVSEVRRWVLLRLKQDFLRASFAEDTQLNESRPAVRKTTSLSKKKTPNKQTNNKTIRSRTKSRF